MPAPESPHQILMSWVQRLQLCCHGITAFLDKYGHVFLHVCTSAHKAAATQL